MPYTRRPTWPDQPACRDYVIQREDLQIGRVYLTNTPYGDRFVWSIFVNDHFRKYRACRSAAGRRRSTRPPPRCSQPRRGQQQDQKRMRIALPAGEIALAPEAIADINIRRFFFVSAGGGYWSGLILPAAISLIHLSISRSIRSRNACGVLPTGTKPMSIMRCRRGSVVTALTAI